MNQLINFRKTIFVTIASLLFAGGVVAPVLAQSSATSSATTAEDDLTAATKALVESKKETNAALRITKLKAAADKIIDARIKALNVLLTKVNNTDRIDDSGKASLVADLDKSISALTSLKTKIDADKDLVTLKADIHSIFTTYRIYMVVLPRDTGLLITYRLQYVVARIEEAETTISNRIDTATAKGQDTTQLTKDFAAFKKAVAAAKDALDIARIRYSSLTPANTAAAKAARDAGQKALHDAIADLKLAREDLKNIRADLKNLKTKIATSSSKSAKP